MTNKMDYRLQLRGGSILIVLGDLFFLYPHAILFGHLRCKRTKRQKSDIEEDALHGNAVFKGTN